MQSNALIYFWILFSQISLNVWNYEQHVLVDALNAVTSRFSGDVMNNNEKQCLKKTKSYSKCQNFLG